MLIVPLALLLSVYFSFGNKIESGRWAAECLAKKSEAVSKKRPHLIILSGSNALFGFSARRMSEVYGVESVNTAVHAGLGLEYILDYGRSHFATNRIFVLPLEYSLYGEMIYDRALRDQVIGYDPGYLIDTKLKRQLKFVFQMPHTDRLRHLRTSITPEPRKYSGYQSRTLNAWGDETNNQLSTRGPEQLARVKEMGVQKFSHNNETWEEIGSFVSDANMAGSKIVLAYPNIYANAFDANLNKEFLAELEIRAAKLGIHLIGKPEESVFGEDRAYDTYYHQNSDGQMTSTDRLFRDLVKSGVL